MEEQTCIRCGRIQLDWRGNQGRGVEKSEEKYCCQLCFDGKDCSCSIKLSEEVIRRNREKALKH